jgi:hypothetical protein
MIVLIWFTKDDFNGMPILLEGKQRPEDCADKRQEICGLAVQDVQNEPAERRMEGG